MSEINISTKLGVVVIGRNEGERLKICLNSLLQQDIDLVVYVDSGSTDDSVEFAIRLGVYVEELDTSIPFTMARGRNTGFQRLMSLHPDLNFVQFVDGDCEVEADWISKASGFLRDKPDISVVCGFRRERFPNETIYNTLIDLEWQGSSGEISTCGGDAMYRTEIFQKIDGFNETLIAGEEPELCLRIRKDGGVIWRLDEKMVIHDADLTKFSQWWTRTKRAGYAYAEGVAMHGSSPYHHFVRELISSLVYGLAVPAIWFCVVLVGVFTSALSLLTGAVALVLAALYLKPFIGAFRWRRRLGNNSQQSIIYAFFCIIAKLPEALGALKYYINRMLGRKVGLIEYKEPTSN